SSKVTRKTGALGEIAHRCNAPGVPFITRNSLVSVGRSCAIARIDQRQRRDLLNDSHLYNPSAGTRRKLTNPGSARAAPMRQYDPMKQSNAKVVLITGAASGIGLAAARLFARDGAWVVMVDRDGERLAAAAAEIDSPSVTPFAADVGSEQEVEQV